MEIYTKEYIFRGPLTKKEEVEKLEREIKQLDKKLEKQIDCATSFLRDGKMERLKKLKDELSEENKNSM